MRIFLVRVFGVAIFLAFSGTSFAGFVNPMDFDGSEAQKAEVIQYIKSTVKKDYCDSGLDMCQNTVISMMEEQNLEGFKKATQAKDRAVMDRVIKDYCYSGLDMCNYVTILMMYEENVAAGSKELTW